MKYSRYSGIVRWSGGTTPLSRGQSADDNHPLVKERPDLWGDTPPGADLPAPESRAEPSPGLAPVERATRAPGERRTAVKKAAPKAEPAGE